jgi:hypothetical protein
LTLRNQSSLVNIETMSRSLVATASVNGGDHVQVHVAVNDHVKVNVQVHVAVLAETAPSDQQVRAKT